MLLSRFFLVEIGYDLTQRAPREWGVADIADSASVAIALASRGGTDGARTAIRGGSAGCFTTLAAVSQPATLHAFTVGTSLFGVSNLTRLGKVGNYKCELHYLDKLIGGTVEEILEEYAERKPINNAQDIRSSL